MVAVAAPLVGAALEDLVARVAALAMAADLVIVFMTQ